MGSKHHIKFSRPLLKWWHAHGRKDLPWQQEPSVYKTWISEIMLQQTQVITVIPYFTKFINRFPDVDSLARASDDDVMSMWSGLGFYSRARNLHKAAKIITEDHNKQIPNTYEALIALPGIGRSTAGAILSLSRIEPKAILDGNVKRVLARFYSVKGDLKATETQKKLWQLAEKSLPVKDYDLYTQAIMDLGATVCTSKKAMCSMCPLSKDCSALEKDIVYLLPNKVLRKKKRRESIYFMIIKDSSEKVLLQKRQDKGIWGGLWSFPELDTSENIEDWCDRKVGKSLKSLEYGKKMVHGFSHFDLEINPIFIKINKPIKKQKNQKIFTSHEISQLGVPKPVKSIIKGLEG